MLCLIASNYYLSSFAGAVMQSNDSSNRVRTGDIKIPIAIGTEKTEIMPDPYCGWTYLIGNRTSSATLFNEESKTGDTLRLNFDYSGDRNETSISVINPMDRENPLNDWFREKILRYTGLSVSQDNFVNGLIYEGEPNWSLMREDLIPLQKIGVVGDCVMEEYALMWLDYAVPYIVLRQDVMENGLKYAEVNLILNEMGFITLTIKSDRELADPSEVVADLFSMVGLPSSQLDNIEFVAI
jgi:hypothetical protein